MMTRLFSLCIFPLGLIMILLSIGKANAQFSFRTIGGDAAPQNIYYELNKQDVPVTVMPDIRSDSYSYNGASPLVFYTLQNGPDGKMVRIPIASVDVSAAGSYPLLFFFKDPVATNRFRILMMKEDAQSFPAGTFRIANFSPFPVQIVLGKETFVIAAGASVDRKASSATVDLRVGVLKSGDVIPVLSSVMPNEPGWRYLLAVSPTNGGRFPVELKNLKDNMPSNQ